MLASALRAGPLESSLSSIVRDEEGHVGLTFEAALRATVDAPDRTTLRREIWRIRAGRAWERWQRLGRGAVDRLATVLLSATYYGLGVLLAPGARRRLASRAVASTPALKRL